MSICLEKRLRSPMVTAVREFITVEIAQKYMEANSHNRPYRPSVAKRYAKDMVEGNWRETHQGIAFDCNGILLDGQHRLMAIVISGCPQWFWVHRNISPESQLVVDDHAKRSPVDSIGLFLNRSVDRVDVAIVRAVNDMQPGDTSRLTTSAIVEDIEKMESGLEFCRKFNCTKRRGISASPIWAAVCCAYYYVKDLDKLDAFCWLLTGVSTPTSLDDDEDQHDADRKVVALREYLLRKGGAGGQHRKECWRKTIKAIIAFAEGKQYVKIGDNDCPYRWPLQDSLRT